MSFKNALDFRGKSILVTGASDGIGYGIAQAFVAAGAHVTITGTREEGSYNRDYSHMNFLQLNVDDPNSVERLEAEIKVLDVLVNCVGMVLYQSQEFTREGFGRVMDINLTGVMHVCTVLRDKLADSRGCIINLDSIVSERAARNNPAYSASKIALKHLNKAFAIKWGKLGIRVNGIGPGMVPTKLTKNQLNEKSAELFEKMVPAGRYGSPEDMAGPVLFLASPLAAYVTGQSLLVDGGLSLISAF